MSTATTTGAKRKERDFDLDDMEATNINVVVRCRGRNEREVRENSHVVVRTEGTKGRLLELAMGPNAVSNKSYEFDRVFSQAADQAMIFEDVVRPVLDEMLAGYNCTIFAYGQTGTGKTYTMSGDLTETMGMLSDNAGIIPRVLQSLFKKLDMDEKEYSVRVSFIELYNEELRDLLSSDENKQLKIFDDTSRKGHTTTIVQGAEERYILNAAEGLRCLQEGSVKRQVAATKCNDLSSRSHTVFTITVYQKHETDSNGEDMFMLGKLNLVDLAGSENIQRSGASDKRAAEAGLINKSLLTLGRVINALVDKSPHIPYRESKLTRLLQDSLGGRTKTCIIATISPARSNLEETISTLDYAFRAKNIRNKPQLNALTNKKALLREFIVEIERLKAELIATRQRNGVYLSNEAYEELTVQNESRRILTEEQAAKIETLEANLKNKLQEFLALRSNFLGLKKENEELSDELGRSKDALEQTELILAATKKSLEEETMLRKAHQETEQKLASLGGQLVGTLKRTVSDIDGLRAKNKRRAELHSLNRNTWEKSQARVAEVTELVEDRLDAFRQDQERHISSVSRRIQAFVKEELDQLAETQTLLDTSLADFSSARARLLAQQERSKEELDTVLEDIKLVRDKVKQRVGSSLQAISTAAERIAADVLGELSALHTHLHDSYASLGRDVKSLFDDLLKHMRAQKAESDRLRRELEAATQAMIEANASHAARMKEVLEEERTQAAQERQALLAQIAKLITTQADLQDSRLTNRALQIQSSMEDASTAFASSVDEYTSGMRAWSEKDDVVLAEVSRSRDALRTQLQSDWAAAERYSTAIQTATKAVHAETVRVVEGQVEDLDVQMGDLDAFVARARQQNASGSGKCAEAVRGVSSAVEGGLGRLAERFGEVGERMQRLGDAVEGDVEVVEEGMDQLEQSVVRPLAGLREEVVKIKMKEYEPTGKTPEKTSYPIPTNLPRTAPHEILLASMRGEPIPELDLGPEEQEREQEQEQEQEQDLPPLPPLSSADPSSPTPVPVPTPQVTKKKVPQATPSKRKPAVLPDAVPTPLPAAKSPAPHQPSASKPPASASASRIPMSMGSATAAPASLREVNPNLASPTAVKSSSNNTASTAEKDGSSIASVLALPPGGDAPVKVAAAAAARGAVGKRMGTAGVSSKGRKAGLVGISEGVENVPPPVRTGGRRKSPRLR